MNENGYCSAYSFVSVLKLMRSYPDVVVFVLKDGTILVGSVLIPCDIDILNELERQQQRTFPLKVFFQIEEWLLAD